MICPRCETPTLISHQRGGMEIDVCSTCSGVWLDRGELERLALTPPAPSSAAMVDDVEPGQSEGDRHDYDDDDDDDDDRKRSKSKSKSLGARVADALDDVFDDVLDIFD